MTGFLLALAAFMAAHIIPAMPGVRARLVGLAGRTAYVVTYSAVSLVLLAWVVVAAVRADSVTLWQPAAWQWILPIAAMPLSFFLLVAGLVQPNPLSVSVRHGDEPGAVTAITRHPVLWGFLIWALAHIPPNGRLVPVILFGAMAALAALGIPLVDRKARKRLGPAKWQALARGRSAIPFASLLAGDAPRAGLAPLAASALAALVLYAWFLLQGHALLIGPDPLAGLRGLL